MDSVAAVLRRKLANLKARINAVLANWPSARDAFELPKETDGLPDDWAFGKLTETEVKEAHFMQALRWVKHEIVGAEKAIAAGNDVSGLLWTLNAIQSLESANAQVSIADTTRQWRYIDKIRKKRAEHAIKGNRARAKYGPADRARWQAIWIELKASNPALRPNSAATIIAKRCKLPSAAASTIRRTLR